MQSSKIKLVKPQIQKGTPWYPDTVQKCNKQEDLLLVGYKRNIHDIYDLMTGSKKTLLAIKPNNRILKYTRKNHILCVKMIEKKV